MRTRILIGLLGLVLSAVALPAYGASTTGNVTGVVTDAATGEPVAGVTVVASGPKLQGQQTEMTDATGHYLITNLPPGPYVVRFYYSDITVERPNVFIGLDKTIKVNVKMRTQAAAGETYTITERAPAVDVASTKIATSIGTDFVRSVPTGRTYDSVMDVAPGAQSDYYGMSIGGASSPENNFIIDGINTTDVAYGGIGTQLSIDFIQETEIITGGYNAEYGRATGGIVNAITKSGSNEFHGSVYAHYTPFRVKGEPTGRLGEAIARRTDLSYAVDFGGEVGGPILKDRLWFWVGFQPTFSSYNLRKLLRTRTDANHDGRPDVDANGLYIMKDIGTIDTFNQTRRTYQFGAKINLLVNPDHTLSASWYGTPGTLEGGLGVNGDKSAEYISENFQSQDVSLRWNSKLFDRKWQIEAIFGWHHQSDDQSPGAAGGNKSLIIHNDEIDYYQDLLGRWGADKYDVVNQNCAPDTLFPDFVKCPVGSYRTGGAGFLQNLNMDRYTAKISGTNFFRGAGHHELKYGFDFEDNKYKDHRRYTNGTYFQLGRGETRYRGQSFGGCKRDKDGKCELDADGNEIPEYIKEGFSSETTTLNFAAFLQDSWSILPNLTLNAGVRWEGQLVQGVDGDSKIKILDNWAPRVGLIYDWTAQGRSKIFAHWGRFYESIPMDINDRAFSKEGFVIDSRRGPKASQAARENPTTGCPDGPDAMDPTKCKSYLWYPLGGEYAFVAPGLKGQYSDEITAGVQYEVLEDLVLGITYINRRLGRVIEDVSTDGGATYYIANPGDAPGQGDIDGYVEKQTKDIKDPVERKAQADAIRKGLQAIGDFPSPKREYNALEITADKRLSKNFQVKASYTYSRLSGNYPGLFSPDTGQLDPNITSLYDLPDLLVNRNGSLPGDRRHQFKVDGAYTLRVKRVGDFVFGGSFRLYSGSPILYLGAHPWYGTDEAYILPRGEGDHRTPVLTSLDLHVSYARDLPHGMKIEAGVDLFNIYNSQRAEDVDQSWTFDDVYPIAGGDESDLKHAKMPDGTPVTKNGNYGNTTSRQTPMSGRFFLRLSF